MRDICLVFLRFWCHKNLSWGTFLLFAECKIGISSSDVWKNSPATSSGPLIFSVKIFLITDSVNLMYTEPLRFSVSSCIHFGKLCFSRIPAVSSVRLIRTVFVVALLDIRSDVPLFVPVLSAVSLFSSWVLLLVLSVLLPFQRTLGFDFSVFYLIVFCSYVLSFPFFGFNLQFLWLLRWALRSLNFNLIFTQVKVFSHFHCVFSFAHRSLRSVLRIWYLLLSCGLISPWSENINSVVHVLWNMSWLDLWPTDLSLLISVPRRAEKNSSWLLLGLVFPICKRGQVG